MTDLLGVTLCVKCKIPFEEFDYEGQATWWFRMRQVPEGTPGWEWNEIPCNNCQRAHKVPILLEYWCPDCGDKEKNQNQRNEGGSHGD